MGVSELLLVSLNNALRLQRWQPTEIGRENMAQERKSWREKLEEQRPIHGTIVKILVPNPLDVVALMDQIPKESWSLMSG